MRRTLTNSLIINDFIKKFSSKNKNFAECFTQTQIFHVYLEELKELYLNLLDDE